MKIADIDHAKRWAAQFKAANTLFSEAQFLEDRRKDISGGNTIRVSDGVVSNAGGFVIEGRDRHGKMLKLNLSFDQVSQVAADLVAQARKNLNGLGVEIEE